MTLTAVLTGGLVAVSATTGDATEVAATRRPARDRVIRWAWVAASAAGALVAATGAVAELPLATARDAALAGDASGVVRACDAAERLRPWDPAVGSICAQNAALGAETAAPPVAQDDAQDDVVRHLASVAVDQADRALRRDPSDQGARVARAVALERLGRLDEARRDLDVHLEAAPDDPAALLRRGVLLARLGDLDAAGADFRHVLAVDPDDAAATRNLEILGLNW